MLVSLKRTSRYLRHHPSNEKRLGRLLLSVLGMLDYHIGRELFVCSGVDGTLSLPKRHVLTFLLGFESYSFVVDGPFSKTNSHSILVPAIPSMAGHPERPYHALISGAIGGYFVWGRYSSINYQIVLYLTSRVIIGLTKRLFEHYYHPGVGHSHHSIAATTTASSQSITKSSNNSSSNILQHPQMYPLMAALVWGCVMVLFEESPHVLHRSLKSSMDEIYRYSFDENNDGGDTGGIISDAGERGNGGGVGGIVSNGKDTSNRVNLTI